MELNDAAVLHLDGIAFRLERQPFPGLTASIQLNLDGALVVLVREQDVDIPGGTTFHVFAGARRVATQDAMPAGGGQPADKMQVALAELPSPYSLKLTVWARLPDGASLHPLAWTAGDVLHELEIRDDQGFSNLIQNPASRLRDESHILFAAIHCLTRFSSSFWITAGAVCVIGYRIIHGKGIDARVNELFRVHLARALEMRPEVSFGIRMRWTVSMRLIGAYVALHGGDRSEAMAHLGEITKFSLDLPEWPSSLTNIMLAYYGLGYLALLDEDRSAAEGRFRDALNLLRYGCLVAKFPNTYSFGELGNALKVAEACFIAQTVCRLGSPIQDGSIAAPGTRIDPRMLPAPLGWLLPPLEPKPT